MKKLLLVLLGHRHWALALATVLSLGAVQAMAQSDDCAGAPLLTSSTTCTYFSSTTQGATQSLPAAACGGLTGTADDDVWYRFVALTTAHTVTVRGGTTFDPVVEVRSGSCPGTVVACARTTTFGGTVQANATGLTVGNTYYIRLYTYSNLGFGRNSFDICVTNPPVPTCTNPTNVQLDNPDNTSTNVFFTPTTGATYTVTYTPTGGTTTTLTSTTSPIALTGLTPGTTYALTFQTTCATTGTSPVITRTFTTQTSPFNDYPDTAPELVMGSTCTPVTSNTLGATPGPTTPASTCGASGALKDVWFVLRTLPGQTAAQITVTGSAAGQIRAFSAPTSSGPFTQIGCAAGTGPNTVSAPLNLTSLQGNRVYYIAVSGYGPNDAQGYFTICAVNTTTAVCNSPSTLQATNITSSGAQISFIPGTNNTSYTVTYTPTGGTATTVTTTGSPVVLTGLTPLTTYAVTVLATCAVGSAAPVSFTFRTTAIPPPVNNDCSGATLLTPGTSCVPVSGTTVSATQSLTAINCRGFAGAADDDVWYRFVATSTSHTVTVTQGDIDAVVDVRSGSCSGINIGCADASNTAPEVLALSGLTVGATYYVRVYSYGPSTTDTGTFTICVTGATAPTCTTPSSVQAGSITSTGVQVSFTPGTSNTSYAVTYTPAGGTATTVTGTASPIALTGLTPGTAYTATIQATCANGGTVAPVSFTFTTAVGTSVPANNDCAAAILLTSGTTCAPVSGTTVGATQSLAAITCGSFTGNADDDVWYRFVATSTAHAVTVAPNATLDAIIDVRAGTSCPGTNIGCANAGGVGSSETVNLTGLTVGTTYYVRVYSYGSAITDGGTFTICVTGGAATCANPADVAFGTATNTSIPLTFTPVAGNTSYIVTYTPANGPTTTLTPAPTSSPAIVSGLTPGTFYTLTFQAVCSGGSTAPVLSGTFVTTTAGITPPANDNPSGATTLAVNSTCTPTSATNLGATVTAPNGYANPGACGVAANPKDVWFKFTTLSGQTAATLTVSGSAAGLVRVFAAGSAAGPFTEVGCSGAAANNTVTAPVSLTGLTGNTTYYVSVSGASSNDTQGAFTICVTGTGTTCPAVTGVSTGSPTATSTTLTFTPVATATAYTVTLTPAGGNPTTSTVTGSPVALTGLTPNSSYAVCVTAICSAGGTAVPACIGFSTPAVPCPAVTDQSVTNLTPTSASVTFTPVAGAVTYTVTYTPQGGSSSTLVVSGSPVNLTGLLPSTQYTVVIRTSCAAGQSSSDATLIFPTATPCAAVTNLAAGSISATGATLTFTPPATGATFFTIAYTPAGGNTITQNSVGSPVPLTGLLPGTLYTVTVTTDCGLGRTSPPVSTTFTTNNPVCDLVTNLAVGNLTSTSAGVSFTPAAGAVGYTLAITPAGGSTTTLAATGSPVALSGLQPGTVYTVTIVTNCAAGQISDPAIITFTTPFAPCPAITSLAANGLTGTGATLTFGPATGAASYVVTVTPQGGTASSQTASGSPVALSGLQPGTTYAVGVVTNCAGSQTSPAVTTTFSTAAPAPTNGTVGSITDTGAGFSFTLAAGASSYTVTYTPQGGTATTLTVTGSPVALTGLLAGTTYTVTIVANYPGGGTSAPLTSTFTTLLGTATRAALAGGTMAVFPNPAHRAFTLSLPALSTTRTARLTLVNALGQTVRQQTITLTAGGTQAQVEVVGLAPGLYTVRVQAGTETATTRLAVE
jgi:hypothetical protein